MFAFPKVDVVGGIFSIAVGQPARSRRPHPFRTTDVAAGDRPGDQLSGRVKSGIPH